MAQGRVRVARADCPRAAQLLGSPGVLRPVNLPRQTLAADSVRIPPPDTSTSVAGEESGIPEA